MYRYIFFDLDGTLTDSKEGIINCALYAMDQLGTPHPDAATMLKFIGPPLTDSFMTFCGYDAATAEKALQLYRQRYVPIGIYENQPVAGGAALLARLKAAGYTLAVASSKPEEMCRTVCDRFEFSPHLDVISGSTLTGHCTKADVIRSAMARLHLTEADRSSILMVGDRKYDAEGAAACGIDCLGVDFFGYAEPGELERAGVVSVVQTVEELERFILQNGGQ